MNRKITPKTVAHFIALADAGYYNGLCVHDYKSSKGLYTGAYSYTDGDLVAKDYFSTVKSYIPKSVWLDSSKKTPTYTLYGEFTANNFNVTNGTHSEDYGSLVMYYTNKAGGDQVSIERNDGKGMATRDYNYNSATSQFYISLAGTATKNKNYCVFATLTSETEGNLSALQKAIDAYMDDNFGEESEEKFAVTDTYTVDENDPVVGGQGVAVTYDVPREPIVVKSVKITKY
jgi:cyclophilin family peptidyl-prolyl cis-trans isomerase